MADGSATASGVQVEIEAVLDVDPGFSLPDLAAPGVEPHAVVQLGLPAVHDLDAAYYDTADLRLISSGITLRRRTGGADEGWHLKLPRVSDDDAGTSSIGTSTKSRVEVHRPLGPQASTPPAGLLALVQAWLRGREVAPVARLRTTRTVHDLIGDDGTRLAELADDAVVAEVYENGGVTGSRWRELEIELTGSSDRELLAAAGQALLAAGARPAATTSKLGRALADRLARVPDASLHPGSGAASSAVLAYLAEQYQELLVRDPMVRLDLPESVHKMRVACRRLRTTLAAFRPLFAGDEGDRLRGEVAWIAGLLGGARDAEVMSAGLVAEIDEHPGRLMVGPVRRRIEIELGRRYREAHAVAVRGLDSRRYGDLLDALQRFLTEPPLAGDLSGPEDSTAVLTKRVARSHHRVARAARLAGATDDPLEHDELLHEVRKAAKRARYAAEVVGVHLPGKRRRKQAKAYEKAAKAVQEVLGDHHDSVVLRDELLVLARQAERAGESAFGYGVMHADLGHKRALDEEAFDQAWHDLRSAAEQWPG